MKQISGIIIIILFSSSIYAQGLELGIKGGLNVAKLNSSAVSESYESKTGMNIGAFATIMFSEKIGIQGEGLFSVVGAKTDTETIDLDYITVPVLLNVKLLEWLNVHAGPQFGFLTNASSSIEDNIKNSDICVVAGVGLDLPLGIKAGTRYIWSVTDISENGIDLKNQTWQIYVGLRLLKLGGKEDK